MSQTKFTPGPWGLMFGMPTNVLAPDGLRVARCDFDGDFDHPEAHANAKLIAAAPDLYAALHAINMMACYASEEDTDSQEDMLLKIGETARAALAKAKGQTE